MMSDIIYDIDQVVAAVSATSKATPESSSAEDEREFYVERHSIKEGTEGFNDLHPVLLQCALLRNVVVFITRQHFFQVTGRNYTYDVFEGEVEGKYLPYCKIEKYLKQTDQPDFRILPANVAQAVVRDVVAEWTSYKKLLKKKQRGEYDGYVSIPGYSDTKHSATFNATYFKATLSKIHLADGIINIPMSNVSIKTNVPVELIRSMKVSYSPGQCFADVVYEKTERTPLKADNGRYLFADMGLDNFISIGSNVSSFKPVIIDGKEMKSVNRYYNKKISTYTEKMKAIDESFASDEFTRKLWADRKNWFYDKMHLISARLVSWARTLQVNTIIIGHNQRWKDGLPFKKPVKQNFAFIPYYIFIRDLKYKASAYGITVVEQEESYTSKASFLDGDFIPTYKKGDTEKYEFSGKRIKRGLYRTKDGHLINADINGAYNIFRKYLQVNSIEYDFSREAMGVVIPPRRVRLSELKHQGNAVK